MRVVDHTSPIRPGHLLILTMRVVRIVRVAVDGFNIFMILRLYVSHCVGPCFAIQRLPQGKWRRVSSLAGTQAKTPSSHRAAASPTRDSPRMCNRRPQGKYDVPCTLCRSKGKGGKVGVSALRGRQRPTRCAGGWLPASLGWLAASPSHRGRLSRVA